MTIEENSALQRNASILEAAIGADHVLFHPETGQFCHLDDIGKAAWNILVAPHTPLELAQMLSRSYAVDTATCEVDTRPFLLKLQSGGFISSGAPLTRDD
jgi:Coenzyme PQQ synthesis protein D (PqqD)